MITQFSNLFVQKTLDAWFGGSALGAPATAYLSGHRVDGTEFSGSGYARFPITSNSTNWPATSGRTKSLGAALTAAFQATADWMGLADLAKLGLYDALTAGDQLALFWFGGTQQYFLAYASTSVFNCTGHGYANGQRVQLDTVPTGLSLPGGVATSMTYYVVNATTNTFQLATTSGGSPVTVSADGVGIVVAYGGQPVYSGNSVNIAIGGITMSLN